MDEKIKKAIQDATGMSDARVEDLNNAVVEIAEDGEADLMADVVHRLMIKASGRPDCETFLFASFGFFCGALMMEVGKESMRKCLSMYLDQLNKGFEAPAGLLWDNKPKKN